MLDLEREELSFPWDRVASDLHSPMSTSPYLGPCLATSAHSTASAALPECFFEQSSLQCFHRWPLPSCWTALLMSPCWSALTHRTPATPAQHFCLQPRYYPHQTTSTSSSPAHLTRVLLPALPDGPLLLVDWEHLSPLLHPHIWC